MTVTKEDKEKYVNKLRDNFYLVLETTHLSESDFLKIADITDLRFSKFKQCILKSAENWKIFLISVTIFATYFEALDKMLELNIIDAKLLIFIQGKDNITYTQDHLPNYVPKLNQRKKDRYCKRMAYHLPKLRLMTNMTVDTLAKIIGTSVTDICLYEKQKKKIPWRVYLILIFVFLQDRNTKYLLISQEVLNDDIKLYFNNNYIYEETDTSDLTANNNSDTIEDIEEESDDFE